MVHNYRSGLGSVGQYQMSGRPYVTGSSTLKGDDTDQIRFPNITKSITVINNNAHDIFS